MITLKLKIEANTESYVDVQRTYSACVRYSVKRFQEGKTEKEIEKLSKDKFLIGSWLSRCAILEAKDIRKSRKTISKSIVYGGRKNFEKRCQGKISQEEWKNLRLRPICSQGEVPQKSNRLFSFKFDQNLIIFKLNKNTHIPIHLKNISKNYKEKLQYLQSQVGKTPITIKLSQSHIYITFEDTRTKPARKVKGRTAGVDLNPNYIGFSIRDKKDVIVCSKVYDISSIEGNKQKYELVEITKDIQSLCVQFGVNTLGLEKLDIQAKQHNKGKKFNQLVNNKWDRNYFISQVSKRMKEISVETIFVLAAYSSKIGNLVYNYLPDMAASAAEIARRASCPYVKELSMWNPQCPSGYANLWKKEHSLGQNWRNILDQIKSTKTKYRVPLGQIPTKTEVFSLKSYKSKVSVYTY